MIFNKEYIMDDGSFCNDYFEEFDHCTIYRDNKVVGKEYWRISLAFFRPFTDNDPIVYPTKYCIELYKAICNGNFPNTNEEISRISIFDPSYIILPDRHYNLTNEEVIRFDSIMSDNWNKLIDILNGELKLTPRHFYGKEVFRYKYINPPKPNYHFLQYYNLLNK